MQRLQRPAWTASCAESCSGRDRYIDPIGRSIDRPNRSVSRSMAKAGRGRRQKPGRPRPLPIHGRGGSSKNLKGRTQHDEAPRATGSSCTPVEARRPLYDCPSHSRGVQGGPVKLEFVDCIDLNRSACGPPPLHGPSSTTPPPRNGSAPRFSDACIFRNTARHASQQKSIHI